MSLSGENRDEANAGSDALSDGEDDHSIDFSADDSSEIDDGNFDFDPFESSVWQEPQPAQFSLDRDLSKCDNWAIYRPLSILDISSGPNDPWIRLLQIKPGVVGEPIHCKLIRRPLLDAEEYHALSYSWGTEPQTCEIYVENPAFHDHTFLVSPHLLCALRRLRDDERVVTVWIDAICIHQQNIVERAAQVQIMAQIFNGASEVRIWLGEHDDYEGDGAGEDRKLFLKLCKERAPWWRRLWVIQECAYSKRCPMVMLGASLLSFERLLERWRSATATHDNFDENDTLRRNLEFLHTPFHTWTIQMQGSGHRLPLLQRLRETHGRQCSDLHDKIYALLSLIDEREAKELRPDYRKPLRELAIDVMGVLNRTPHWVVQDKYDLRDLFRLFNLRPYEATALLHGRPLKEYQEALVEASAWGDLNTMQGLLRKCAALTSDKFYIHSAFEYAVSRGRVEAIRLLLEAGADVNTAASRNSTMLCIACEQCKEDMVRILLDANADVNADAGPDGTALYTASEKGCGPIVQMLIEAGANVNAPGRRSDSALHAAVEKGHWPIVQMLIDAGADVNSQEGPDGNDLYTASENGHDRVVQILTDAGADVNAQAGLYGNALQVASVKGHYSVLQKLLDAGANVNLPGGFYSNALYAASYLGHTNMVQVLAKRGADPNASGGLFANALQAASVRGHHKIVQVLIEAGAKIDARGGYYENALQGALFEGQEETAQLLIEQGADVNARAGQYGYPLHEASSQGREEIVKALINTGAKVNAEGGYYGNPLQAACVSGNAKVVQMLIDARADVNARGGVYETALLAASFKGHTRVVEMLVNAGADVNVTGRSGKAREIASRQRDGNMIQILLDAELNAKLAADLQRIDGGNAPEAAPSGDHSTKARRANKGWLNRLRRRG